MNWNKHTNGSRGTNSPRGQMVNRRRGGYRINTRSGSSLRSIVFGVLRGILVILSELSSCLFFLRYLLLLIAMFYCVVLGTKVILGVLDLPEVHFSSWTGECVRVITKDGPGDCDNLPAKYHRRVVE